MSLPFVMVEANERRDVVVENFTGLTEANGHGSWEQDVYMYFLPEEARLMRKQTVYNDAVSNFKPATSASSQA